MDFSFYTSVRAAFVVVAPTSLTRRLRCWLV